MADFEIKSHDQLPSIETTLAISGQPVNLTSALGVDFIMRSAGGGPIKVNAPAQVVDVAAGVVRYDWEASDTDMPGQYQAEFEVTWTGGKKQTFPTKTYHTIEVLADLDGA